MSQIVVSSGTTSVTTVDASNTFLVEDSGTLEILDGGVVSGLITVVPAGALQVDAGGTALSATISGVGLEIVLSGGVDSGAQISGGELDVYGLASGARIFGGLQIVEAGGTAISAAVTADSGGGVHAGRLGSCGLHHRKRCLGCRCHSIRLRWRHRKQHHAA